LPGYRRGLLPGDFSATIDKDGARLGILGLNTAFLQLADGDYQGRLALHARQFHGACGDSGPDWARQHHACLLLTHHSPVWLDRDARGQLDGQIASYGRFALHLCGHAHETALQQVSEGGTETRRQFQGRSLCGLEHYQEIRDGRVQRKVDRSHGYAAGRLELTSADTGNLLLWPRRAWKRRGQLELIAEPDVVLPVDEHTEPIPIKLLQPFRAQGGGPGHGQAISAVTHDIGLDASSSPRLCRMPDAPGPTPAPTDPQAPATTPPAGPERRLVYLSYSHQDRDWHRRLRAVLDAHPALKDRIWDDTKLRAGRSVTQEIRAHVPQARVMIMLGSPDYFAPGCGARELETLPALADWQRGDLDILWLRVRGHPIAGTPVADIMAANGPGAVPLDSLVPDAQDAALRHLRDQVLDLIGASPAAGTPATAARFHCFLSHNSSDKPRVRELARALAARGLNPWLDEEQLRPGLPWQPLLEQGIRDSAAVAVCIAADGLGPWQDAEMQAALQLAVRNPSQPVMAVLLPGAPDQPALPAFLAVRGWVDLRGGLKADGLDRLIWGITGQRLGSPAAWPGAPAAGAQARGGAVDEQSAVQVVAADTDADAWKVDCAALVHPTALAQPKSPDQPTPPVHPTPLPQAAAPDAPTYPRAAAIWRKKLDFLLEQEALSSNPAQRFEIAEQIAECRAKLRELGVQP